MASEAGASSKREIAYDAFKGVAIFAVVAHHVLGFSTRRFADSGTVEWWTYQVLNRLTHFAVPSFLFLSALLLARSLAKSGDLRAFYSKRVMGSLYPYLLWSLIYCLVRAYIGNETTDVGGVSVPTPLSSLSGWINVFIWGKASYHLYFLSILLQMTVLLPAFVWMVRRFRANWALLIGVALIAQLAFYLANANWRGVFEAFVPYTGTSVIWYLLPICVGVWCGLNRSLKQDDNGWFVGVAWLFAIAGIGVYLLMDLTLVEWDGSSPLPWYYNNSVRDLSLMVNATGLSLLLMNARWSSLGGGPAVGVVLFFGAESLGVFLVHPLILRFLGGPTVGGIFDSLPGAALWLFAFLCALSIAFVAATSKLRVHRLLFGR
ncbi:MAG: acyltransferase [Armatimonadetes bacterium]|nr:acyltransferase [Armatimonadota bacterium]